MDECDKINCKHVLHSKTLWANMLLLALAILDALLQTKWIRPDVLVFAGVVVNSVLRIFFTTTAVSIKK